MLLTGGASCVGGLRARASVCQPASAMTGRGRHWGSLGRCCVPTHVRAWVQARRMQSVIALLVEGNWLPISNVIISQVGKYRYAMYSPHQSATVHVVVDVMLVGRTKVISLHSTVWLENSTDLPVRVRLHVPPSLLAVTPTVDTAPPGAARTASGGPHPSRSASMGCMTTRSASRMQTDAYAKRAAHEGEIRRGVRDADRQRSGEAGSGSDVYLRLLRPGQGQYLPLAAVLQSTVSFIAEGVLPSSGSAVPAQ